MKQIVILGGGTGGTLTANRLRKEHPADEVAITVVDQDDRHLYQPGLLFVPFGMADPDEISRSRGRQLHDGIDYVVSPIDRVDLEANQVHLADSVLATTVTYLADAQATACTLDGVGISFALAKA